MSIKKFKSWQKKPIEYMTRECINNDGIFLFHYMGTGKSLTAIGIAHNLGLPYVIICPEALINQWHEDYVNVYQKHLPTNVGIIGYIQAEDFLKNKDSNWFSKTTLIMDEAHNYSKYIHTIPLKKLQSFKKRILLSATPIYNSASDLSYIVNIVGGSNVFPIDPKVFEERYYKLYTNKSIVFGWIHSNLVNFNKILSASGFLASLGFTAISSTITRYTQQLGGPDYKDYLQITKEMGFFYEIPKKLTMGLLPFMEAIANPFYRILGYISKFLKKGVLKELLEKFDGKSIKSISGFDTGMEMFKDSSSEKGLSLSFLDTSILQRYMMASAVILILGMMITVTCFILKKIFSDANYNKGKETYFEPDFAKIQKELGPYISYYTPDKNSKDFPKVKDVLNYISLNCEQILVLMKYTISKLTFEDYLSLGIFQNYNECEELLFDQKDYDIFLNYGRFIGNICYFKNELGLNEYIIDKVLYYNEKDCRCYLNKGYDFKMVSPKYKEIKKYRSRHPNKKIVIYTGSSLAAKTLSTYLTSTGIDNQLLLNSCSPQNFKNILQRYYHSESILILDSGYYEGISILNTDTMFLLEPINNISQNLQARARIVRLDSHPPGSRVEIVNLLSTMSIINKYIGSIRAWLKTSKYVMYNFLYTEHNQHITPDMIAYNKIKNLSKESNRLVDVLKKTAIEYTEPLKECQRFNCQVGELNESSHCGQVLSSYFMSKKSIKKSDSKSSRKSVSRSSRKSMSKKNN